MSSPLDHWMEGFDEDEGVYQGFPGLWIYPSRDYNSHSLFSPSGASQWMVCTASIKAGASVEAPPPKDYTLEGSAAHWVVDLALRNNNECDDYIGQEYIDEETGVIVPITAGMMEDAQLYVDYCRSVGGEVRRYETKLRLVEVMNEPKQFGTSDCVIYDRVSRVLHVIDLKFGRGVQVYAERNRQGMIYALGVLRAIRLDGEDPVSVVIHIVQPRLEHFDTWEVGLDDLMLFQDEVRVKVLECKSPDAVFAPGHDTCRFCDYKPHCRALAQYMMREASDDFQPEHLDDEHDLLDKQDLVKPDALGPHQWGKICRIRDFFKTWIDDVHAYAEAQAMKGEDIPGQKIVRAKARNLKWLKDENPTQNYLRRQGLSTKDFAPRKLITPTQAEKMVNKLEDKKGFKLDPKWAARAEAPVIMVPITDRRNPVDPPNAPAIDFADDTGTEEEDISDLF